MVVVFIIGLLASIVGPTVFGAMSGGKLAKVKADFATLNTALKMYRLDYGHYPAEAQGLAALVSPPRGDLRSGSGVKKYIEKIRPDPWQQPYLYTLHADGEYTLKTPGADGVPGGEGENKDLKHEDF